MNSTSQEISDTLREKYEMTTKIVNEASEQSIQAHEYARITNDADAIRVAHEKYEYLQGVIAVANRHSLEYDEKLDYLHQKLHYENTGDEQYGEIVRLMDACKLLTNKYAPTINQILHHAQLHRDLIEFYSESPIFYFDTTSIMICQNGLYGHYKKLMILFKFDDSEIYNFIYGLFRLALKIRREHVTPASTEFIQRCREKYVIPFTLRQIERSSRILKTATPLVDDTICEIVSFMQSNVDRRRADTIIYNPI
jgi:hypothetical protein